MERTGSGVRGTAMGSAAVRCALVAVLAMAIATSAAIAQTRKPIQGGISHDEPPPGGLTSEPTWTGPICGQYATRIDPLRGRMHVVPKVIGGGRPPRCEPPRESWKVLGEDRGRCCYFAPFDQPINGVIVPIGDVGGYSRKGWRCGVNQADPAQRTAICIPPSGERPEDPPPERPGLQPPAQVPPSGPPPRPQPQPQPNPQPDPQPDPQPPGQIQPTQDPGYVQGVRDGFTDCGKSVEVLLQAMWAMSNGNFERAAQLLGMTDSASGLRALWQEIVAQPVIDMNGRRLTAYEVGRRQALRICMYVLLPKAQACAIKATACAVKATVQACGRILTRLAELRGAKLPIRLPRAPDPKLRGLPPADDAFLRDTAVSEGKVILVRDSNPAALRWIGQPGYAPKPKFLKAKTLKESDLAGVPRAEAERYVGLASAQDMTMEEIAAIRRAGFEIGPQSEHFVIRSARGTRYYSDADLHGVYNLDGTSGWTREFASKLNCQFIDRLIQHGPHDLWPDRLNRAVAGPNYGPQVGNGKSMTAYLPDGSALHITTLEQMKAFYGAIGVRWQSVYPGI